MLTSVITAVLIAVAIYLGVGLVFGLFFITLGVGRVDPMAEGTGWGFRLLILPGTVALWPLLATRWLGKKPLPIEDNAHRRAAEEYT